MRLWPTKKRSAIEEKDPSLEVRSGDPNSSTVNFIKFYISLKDPKYAVVLNGPWGSGKTHLINRYSEQIGDKYDLVRISLNGVRNIVEIESQIQMHLYPILTHPAAKFAMNGAKIVFKAAAKAELEEIFGKGNVDLKLSDKDYKKHAAKLIKPKILIVDDFERVQMKAPEILGFLNKFVEDQGLKMIILANLAEASELKGNEKHFEKIVGRVFPVFPWFEEFYEAICGEYAELEVGQVLQDNKDSVMQVFSLIGNGNLRNVRYAMQEFVRIYSLMRPEVKSKKELVSEVLAVICWLSLKLRETDMGSVGILDLEKAIEGIPGGFTKYNIPLSLDLCHQLFVNGDVSEGELNYSIQKGRHFVTENTPLWQKLWRYTFLRKNDFDFILSQTIEHLKRGAIRDDVVLKHLSGIFASLIKEKIVAENEEYYLALIVSSIDKLKGDGSLRFPLQSETRAHTVDGDEVALGFSYREQKSKLFISVKSILEAIESEIRISGEIEYAKGLPTNIVEDIDTVCWDISVRTGIEGKYSQMPILEKVEVDSFCGAIMQLDGEKIFNLSVALRSRYSGYNGKKLVVELEFLRKLKLEIEERLNNCDSLLGWQLRNFMLVRIDEAIQVLSSR